MDDNLHKQLFTLHKFEVVIDMGWKISEQTVRFLLCNEGSDDDIESIKETLEPFNLFAFVLHNPSVHLDLDRKLNETLGSLDLVSADRFLFFAFVEPDNRGANRPKTRPYYRDLQSWENKIFPNGSISCEIEQIVREIARSLNIPFDMAQFVYLVFHLK